MHFFVYQSRTLARFSKHMEQCIGRSHKGFGYQISVGCLSNKFLLIMLCEVERMLSHILSCGVANIFCEISEIKLVALCIIDFAEITSFSMSCFTYQRPHLMFSTNWRVTMWSCPCRNTAAMLLRNV